MTNFLLCSRSMTFVKDSVPVNFLPRSTLLIFTKTEFMTMYIGLVHSKTLQGYKGGNVWKCKNVKMCREGLIPCRGAASLGAGDARSPLRQSVSTGTMPCHSGNLASPACLCTIKRCARQYSPGGQEYRSPFGWCFRQ